jgi:hypothetical protein
MPPSRPRACSVAVCWAAICIVLERQHPQPWHSYGAASDLNRRPTTRPSQSTSKSSSFQLPDGRLAEARLRRSCAGSFIEGFVALEAWCSYKFGHCRNVTVGSNSNRGPRPSQDSLSLSRCHRSQPASSRIDYRISRRISGGIKFTCADPSNSRSNFRSRSRL